MLKAMRIRPVLGLVKYQLHIYINRHFFIAIPLLDSWYMYYITGYEAFIPNTCTLSSLVPTASNKQY